MSIDHFIVIRFPLRHRIIMRKRVVFFFITVTWLLSAQLSLIDMFLIISKWSDVQTGVPVGWDLTDATYCQIEEWYLYRDETSFLVPVGQPTDSNIRRWITITLVSFPFCLMIILHSYNTSVIIRVLRDQETRLRNHNMSSKEQDIRLRKSRTKGLCTTILLLLTFAIVWLPLQVTNLMSASGSKLFDNINRTLLSKILIIITTLTGLWDILIYFLRSREFGAAIKLHRTCLHPKTESPKSSNNQISTKHTVHTNI